jgi:hypothetical protein
MVLMAVLLVLVALVVGAAIWTGVSLQGGMGNTNETLSGASQVASAYRTGLGSISLDLSRVQFPAKGQVVEASTGMGNVTIDVPSDAVVTVHASAGMGNVYVFGQKGSNIEGTFTDGRAAGPHHLTLDDRSPAPPGRPRSP